jgi:hypothetical protein
MVKPNTGTNAIDLYRLAVTLDEFPQNDHEATAPVDQLQFGTSVRAGLKAGVQLGYFSNYVWAFSVSEIEQFLLSGMGTIIMGTVWKRGMANTNEEGILEVSGRDEGGHCWDITGINTTRGLVRCQNSWGRAWGDNGRFWLSLENLEILLNEDGEAAVPTEIKLPKAA